MAVFLAILFLSSAIFYSCRKTDTLSQVEIDPTVKFFNLSGTIDPAVKKIADKIKQQNEKKNFVADFANREGYPLWEKAVVMKMNKNTGTSSPNFNGSSFSEDDLLVIIPLILQNSSRVHGLLFCKIVIENISIKVIDGSMYKEYTANPDLVGMNGEQASLLVMKFDKIVFGHTYFKVIDSAAFGISINPKTKYIKILDSSAAVVAAPSPSNYWEWFSTTVYFVTFEPDICGCFGEPVSGWRDA